MSNKKRRLKIEAKAAILIALFAVAALCLTLLIHSSRQYTLDLSYPEELRRLYDSNPEARSFVLTYHREKDEAHPVDLSHYKHSEDVPLFLQWDIRWGFEEYAGECAAASACGPLCLSMVGYHLTKDESRFSPDKVIEFSKDKGYGIRGIGTSWSLLSEGAAELGLNSEVLPLDENIMINALEQGRPIILIMGPGKFTASGHFIVLCSYKNGKFTVNDPNSVAKSEKRWSYSEICDEIMNIWAFSPAE